MFKFRFKNVYHVGAFLRRLVLYMDDSPLAGAVETAVYTRNRMFRLVGSSKMGSERVLRSEAPWWELIWIRVPFPSPHYPSSAHPFSSPLSSSLASPPLPLFSLHTCILSP